MFATREGHLSVGPRTIAAGGREPESLSSSAILTATPWTNPLRKSAAVTRVLGDAICTAAWTEKHLHQKRNGRR